MREDRPSVMTRVVNIEEFYAEDERRRRSAEVDYGLEWRDSSDGSAVFAVRWIRDTGEVYALRKPLPPLPMAVHEEAVLAVPLSANVYRVAILGHAQEQEALEVLLEGWQLHEMQPDGLQWVCDRLADLR